MSARSVVVVMPFGGKKQPERRRAILNFKRLEYLVRNKCSVIPASPRSTERRVHRRLCGFRACMSES